MRYPTRLSRKLLAGLALGLGVASLVFLGLFIETYRHQISVERANASEQVNRLLQVSLENAMLKRDLPGLQDIVTRLGHQTGIAAVRIVNPQREVRFASDPAQLHAVMSFADLGCPACTGAPGTAISGSTQLVALGGGAEVLRSVNPIANRDACKSCHGAADVNPVNGILVVDHDATGIRGQALRAAAAMAGAGVLVVLMGLGTVWLVLKRQVLAPVSALDGVSKALAAGDLKARVPVSEAREDELSDLCRSFNSMADKIESGVRDVKEKEAFLKTLIDTVPDGVRVIDEDYQVIMANDSYARQAGSERSALVGVPCYAIHGQSERCPPTLVTCPFHAIKQDGAPIKYIHRHVRADGSDVYVETTAARLTVESNGQARVLIIEAIRDLEQQVKYSQEQRLSEIGQLAAGVAHEIYNPLASIRLGLQAILRRTRTNGQLDIETTHFLDMVDGEVDKCIGVTKRLLDLSQVPSQSLQLVSFTTIIPEVLSLLRFESEKHHVALDIALGEQDLRVLATDSELRMLILNLAQNAFHAMPDGGKLSIAGGVDGDRIVVTFTDTGVGIPADDLSHIFEPFFSRRADGVHGTGLGLTICKAIATRYNGTVSATSCVGSGTAFTIDFPRADRNKAQS